MRRRRRRRREVRKREHGSLWYIWVVDTSKMMTKAVGALTRVALWTSHILVGPTLVTRPTTTFGAQAQP